MRIQTIKENENGNLILDDNLSLLKGIQLGGDIVLAIRKLLREDGGKGNQLIFWQGSVTLKLDQAIVDSERYGEY